jgi:minor extracellular protease Epr
MKREWFIVFLIVFLLFSGSGWAKGVQRRSHQKLLGISAQASARQKVIVRFRSEGAMERLAAKIKGPVRRRFKRFAMVAADLSGREAAALAKDPGVQYIESDYVYQLLGPVTGAVRIQEDASSEEYQYGLGNMGVTEALHAQGYTGKGIKVGVIDSGLDSLHPDLDVDGGWNFETDDIYYGDVVGHGTHVAGIIAAKRNGYGVVGVAPEADLYSLRVCNPFGCSTSAIINSVQWSIDHHLDIINLSLGGPQRSAALEEVMDRAYQDGVLIVAAAGNSGRSNDSVLYPAKYDSVIAVSAVDEDNRIADFSSRGPAVELAAPGVDIYSTFAYPVFDDHIYMSLSGTSMASPHIAGLAALVMGANPGISNVEVRQKLANMAVDLGAAGRDIDYGWGIPQADRRPDQADAHAPVADTGGPYRTVVGEPVTFTGQGSLDMDDNVLTFAWDFGDGTTGVGRGAEHAYQEPGVYPATLHLRDPNGLMSTAESSVLVAAGELREDPINAADAGYVDSSGRVSLGRSMLAGIASRRTYYGVAQFAVTPNQDMVVLSAELRLTCSSRSPQDEGIITAGLLPPEIARSWPAITYGDIAAAVVLPLESPIAMSYLHSQVYEGAEHRFPIRPEDLAAFEEQIKSGRAAFRMALETGLSSNRVSWTNPRLVIRYLARASTDNMAPVAEAGYDRRVVTGSQVILDGSASHDFEDNDLTYRWTQVSGRPVNLGVSTDNPAVAWFSAPNVDDVLVFELEVADADHTSVDKVTIYLKDAPADIHQAVLTPGFGKAGYVHEYLSDRVFSDKPVILSGIQDWLSLDDTDFQTFGVLQFNLSSIPPGSQVVEAALELTGAWKWVGKPAKFEVQLLEPAVDGRWEELDYASVTGADPLLTLSPTLTEYNLGENLVNRFSVGSGYLEDRRASTDRLTFRIDGPKISLGHGWMWFTWWSGNRADTADMAPRLVVKYGAVQPVDLPPPVENRPPVPEIVAPATTGEPGVEYPFTFSAVDPDGDPMSLHICWGDGICNLLEQVMSGEPVELSYAWVRDGDYTVTLEAIDDRGASASAMTIMRIRTASPPPVNHPPVIDLLSGAPSGFVGTEYVLTVAAADVDGDPVRFTVDWDDGVVDTTDYYPSGETLELTHVWQQPGVYDIAVSAEDGLGGFASRVLAVEIQAGATEELIISDAPTGTWYLGSGYGRIRQGQTFRAIGSRIHAVSVALVRIGNPRDPIRVSLRRTLTAAPLAVTEVEPSAVASADPERPDWVTIYFEDPVPVQEGYYYYLMLEATPDTNNYYRVGYDQTNPYPYGFWYVNSTERRDLDMACSLTFAD